MKIAGFSEGSEDDENVVGGFCAVVAFVELDGGGPVERGSDEVHVRHVRNQLLSLHHEMQHGGIYDQAQL